MKVKIYFNFSVNFKIGKVKIIWFYIHVKNILHKNVTEIYVDISKTYCGGKATEIIEN